MQVSLKDGGQYSGRWSGGSQTTVYALLGFFFAVGGSPASLEIVLVSLAVSQPWAGSSTEISWGWIS